MFLHSKGIIYRSESVSTINKNLPKANNQSSIELQENPSFVTWYFLMSLKTVHTFLAYALKNMLMLGLVLGCDSFKRTPDLTFINHPTLLVRNAKLLTQSSDGCGPSNGGEILQGGLAEQWWEAKYMLPASKCSFLRLSSFIFSARLRFLPCPHKKTNKQKTTAVFFHDTPNNTFVLYFHGNDVVALSLQRAQSASLVSEDCSPWCGRLAGGQSCEQILSYI